MILLAINFYFIKKIDNTCILALKIEFEFVYIFLKSFCFQEDQCCPNMATAIKPSKISDMTSKKIY